MNTNSKHFGLRGLAIIVVIGALLFGGISVTGAAAQAAIPGDALYPVKTTIEKTRLSLAKDAGDRSQMKMAFAEQRLGEISSLINEGRYREVSFAVLAFEADINSAILELETVAKADPTRAAGLALEITSALTRYAQTLSSMSASAPEPVKTVVSRALDTTQVAGSLDYDLGNGNANGNDNAGDDSSANSNSNGSVDDSNANSNDNGDDDNISNSNDNAVDDSNSNSNDNAVDDSNGNSNDNSDDDRNSNSNDNAVEDRNSNSNDNANDDRNVNSNDNAGDDSNTNINDSGSDNGNDSSVKNDNGDDKGGNDNGGDDQSGKGKDSGKDN